MNDHYHVVNSPPPVSELSYMNTDHAIKFYHFKCHFNIILPPTSSFSKRLLFVRFLHQEPCAHFCYPHTCPNPYTFQPHYLITLISFGEEWNSQSSLSCSFQLSFTLSFQDQIIFRYRLHPTTSAYPLLYVLEIKVHISTKQQTKLYFHLS